jgi:hypothetical protein
VHTNDFRAAQIKLLENDLILLQDKADRLSLGTVAVLLSQAVAALRSEQTSVAMASLETASRR